MIWIILIAIVVIILIRFFMAMDKDNDDLAGQTLAQKFKVVAHLLNLAAFDGAGHIRTRDKRSFHIYEDGANQIVIFDYSTGHLTITWKFKYFQKEVVHKRQFNDVRNLSLFEQERVAQAMINDMTAIIARHKLSVLTGI